MRRLEAILAYQMVIIDQSNTNPLLYINQKIAILIYHNYFVVFIISIHHPLRQQFYSCDMYVLHSEYKNIVHYIFVSDNDRERRST